MEVAIVILNWNGKQLLQQFLPSVVKYSEQHATVYVADNASTDDSIEFVTSHFPSVKVIQNEVNGGYAKGYNDALAKIDADIYCLLNSDIEVTENWLPSILKAFEDDENTAAIQPKILDCKDKTKFEYAGAAGGFIDALGYPYCRGRVFDTIEADHGQYNNDCSIFWASGACFFIRANVYHVVGGLDEDYFAHQEEIDLCWRIRNLGYDLKYIGSSSVYHVGGATLGASNPKKTYLNFRNSLLSILKNVPKSAVVLILLLRLILDGLAGLKFLIAGELRHTLAILKAHFSFYRNVPKFVKKRRALKQQGGYYIHKSVVWQYYLRGRKYFTDLR